MNQNAAYLFFTGYCQVAAASELLHRQGINNRIVKAPVAAGNSCNFSVLISGEQLELSRLLLRREGVEPRKVYAMPGK